MSAPAPKASKAPAGKAPGASGASPRKVPGASGSPSPAPSAGGKSRSSARPSPSATSRSSPAPSSAASAAGTSQHAAPSPTPSAPTPSSGGPTPIPGETPALPSRAVPSTQPQQPSAANDPWANPKATTMRLLVAADEEVIPDWKQKRIVAICPMNMPIKGFLERALKLKLNWDDMNHVKAVEASGTDLSNIRPKPSGDVLEVALTPHQLKIKPDSINWVWLRPKTDYDGPEKTTKELMLERLQRFYHFHDPTKVEEAEAKLANFEGQEELLFVKLVSQYGPEPTPDQVRRKMVTPQQLAAQAASNRSNTSRATTPATGLPQSNASDRSSRQQDFDAIANTMNLASVMSRTSDNLMMITYYKRWLLWMKTKKESRRVCAFMSGNMDTHLRKDYFQKWRVFFQTKKINKQLQASTQMAYKSESLVGDLATENMFLKGEVKKLHAQVEVLDSANNKRLETLFSSSEAAIGQIQLLTRENQQKEELINKLESKLMNVGNLMLQANEEKDQILQQTQDERVALEEEVVVLREKVGVLEAGMSSAQQQLDDFRSRSPPRVDSFPEYQRMRHECDVHIDNHDKLRAKIDSLEKEKQASKESSKKQQAQIKSLQREVQSLQEEIAAMRHFGHQSVVPPAALPPLEPGRASPDSEHIPPPPGPPPDDDDTDGSRPPSPERRMTVNVVSSRPPQARATPGAETTSSAPPRQPVNDSFFSPATQVPPNAPTTPEMIALAQQNLAGQYGKPQLAMGPSFGDQHNQQQQQQQAGVLSNASFVTADSHTQRWADPALQALRQQQQAGGGGSPQYSGDNKVNISLDSFFDREEKISREKMKLYMDRHMQPRYESLQQTAGTNKSSIGTFYRIHQPAAAQPPPFVTPGGIGTAEANEAQQQQQQQGSSPRMNAESLLFQQQMQNEAVSTRPKAEPRHTTYGTGDYSGTRREMKSSLFSFLPTSIK